MIASSSIDQNIAGPEQATNGLLCLLHTFGIRYVAGYRNGLTTVLTDFPGGDFSFVGRAIKDGYLDTLPCKLAGHGTA
ncbi:hypothetical protein D3C71_2159160 [compost metagenome]